ncbi:hypothetical protein M3231_19825 [Neobacillus mesonae]|nr:hypothetical protein [Neobacillus mesonae]
MTASINNKETYKEEYLHLWRHIEEMEDSDARKTIDSLRDQLLIKAKSNSNSKEFRSYMRTPLPYIAMSVGTAIPIVFLVFIICTALALE